MSQEVELTGPTAGIGGLPDRRDIRAFTELYAPHAAHVFDYCRVLAGSDAVAASATRAALVRARQLPAESHLLRTQLMAAARQETLAFAAAGSGWPGAGAAGLEAPGDAVGDTLSHLPAGQREVLALVYRHGIWPEQLAEVVRVPARDAYQRLAAAEQDFVTVATERGSSAACPALEDIGAGPLATVPGSVWRDAVAELTARTSVASALPRALHVSHRHDSLAAPRRRLRLTIAAAVPAVAVACWAIVAGAGSAHPVGVHDTGQPSAAGIAPRHSWSTATPDGVGTSPARQGTGPARTGAPPVIPVLALLPSTPAGTVLPVTPTTTAAGDPAPTTSPAASASPSSSSSSAAPSPAASTSSAAPSPSASASASASASTSAPSPAPSDSASASTSVPDPSPTS